MCKLDLIHYKKGQVWMLKDESWTTEQRDMGITVGNRPVIIMNDVNIRGSYATVIPCSSNPNYKNGVFINLDPDTLSIALVQEIRPVSIDKLAVFLGSLSDRIMEEIDIATKIYFGFENNPELTNKYFKYNSNKRGTINDIISSNTNTKTDVNIEPVVDSITDTVTEVKPKRKKYNLNTMSDEEKDFIIKSNQNDVAKRFNIANSTAYRWKRTLSPNATNKPVEVKKPTPPPIISTTKYSNKTYKKFANKKLINLNDNEKRLFTKMDSCKLSTTMNVPLQAICTAQASFREQLNIK